MSKILQSHGFTPWDRVYIHPLVCTSSAGFSSKFLWDHGQFKNRVNIPRLSSSFIKIVAYAQSLYLCSQGSFHKSSTRTYASRLLRVHALRIPTRRRIPDAGNGVQQSSGHETGLHLSCSSINSQVCCSGGYIHSRNRSYGSLPPFCNFDLSLKGGAGVPRKHS